MRVARELGGRSADEWEEVLDYGELCEWREVFKREDAEAAKLRKKAESSGRSAGNRTLRGARSRGQAAPVRPEPVPPFRPPKGAGT